MTRRAPTTNRTYPLFPDPTLFRSVDQLRRQRRRTEDIEAQPESVLAVDPVVRHEVKIPEGLLSPRQALVLELLYQRDMTPGEAAEVIGIDPQTVRSKIGRASCRERVCQYV